MRRYLLSLVAAGFVLAACTVSAAPGANAPSAGPRVITLEANDQLKFVPATITVKAGETITFRVANTGAVEHEFMVGPKQAVLEDGEEGTAEIEGIEKGQTKELTFTFAEGGEYAFACHELGHFEAGMVGSIAISR